MKTQIIHHISESLDFPEVGFTERRLVIFGKVISRRVLARRVNPKTSPGLERAVLDALAKAVYRRGNSPELGAPTN